MGLRLLEGPAATPVSRAEAKAQLRVDHSDEDVLIDGLIAAATARLDGASGTLGRALVSQRWAWDVSCPPRECVIWLPLPPLISVQSVEYFDGQGAPRTLDPALYRVLPGEDGGLELVAGASWPSVQRRERALTISFTAGYGAASAVPATVKQAILLLVGHWYLNREAVTAHDAQAELPLGVAALLSPLRVWRV